RCPQKGALPNHSQKLQCTCRDQQLNDYSNFYVINTNVTRDKKYNDANVTGSGFTFADKKNKYAVDGSFALSQILEKNDSIPNTMATTFGNKYFFGARKISGNYQFGISRTFTSTTYNQLDLSYSLPKLPKHPRLFYLPLV
ncbi:MAG: hypothetical protein IPL69_20000, partial [Saprospiraceae bacterium]|nr:hypothetical protein [Candidatus Brachybacter algidus]